MNRIGLFLLFTGMFLLLDQHHVPAWVQQLTAFTRLNVPLFLIGLGFLLAQPVKKRKSQR